jgi:hypothetical protein
MKKLITIFFLFGIVQAQTRFYIGSLTVPTVAQTPYWNTYALAAFPSTNYLLLSQYPFSIVNAANTVNDSGVGTPYGAVPHYLLCLQAMTEPLMPQTILSGSTITIQFKVSRSTGSIALKTNFIQTIKLINQDGSVALEIDSTNSKYYLNNTFVNTGTNYTFKTNITVTAGQRICFDIGVMTTASGINGAFVRPLRSYAINTADLPVDDTTKSALNSWIEFSQNLKFQLQTNHFF